MDVRVGDFVRIKPLRVERVDEYILRVTMPAVPHDQHVHIHVSHVEEVIMGTVNVGDKARLKYRDQEVTVLAIDGDYAWVKLGDGRFTARLEDLSRI